MNKHEIHDRIYKYVLTIIRLINKYPKTSQNQIITSQLIRSITSVGANDQEADGSFTKADFIHCYTIVRKELKESVYWLRLLNDLNTNRFLELEQVLNEGLELIKIVTAIILKTKKRK